MLITTLWFSADLFTTTFQDLYIHTLILHTHRLKQHFLSSGSIRWIEALGGEGIGPAAMSVQHAYACRSVSSLEPDLPCQTS